MTLNNSTTTLASFISIISNAVHVLCKSILEQCIPIFKSLKIGYIYCLPQRQRIDQNTSQNLCTYVNTKR